MSSNRLLIFANDAGSANVTMAYASLYAHKYDKVLAYPQGAAQTIYQQHIPQLISQEDFVFLPTDTIVTGTSGIHSDYEMQSIMRAHNAHVNNIITILDSTANFLLRFSINGKLLDENHLPNEIWVPNENFLSGIQTIDDRIIYTQNIYDVYIKQLFQNQPPQLSHPEIIKHQGQYILILTEYLSELYGDLFGFSEFDYLNILLQTITSITCHLPVFVKLHPSEKSDKYDEILRKYDHLAIIKDNFNIHELVYYSRVVFGMNSSVFKEALMFSKPIYSVQIGAKKSLDTILKEESIITTKQQLIKILTHFKEIQ